MSNFIDTFFPLFLVGLMLALCVLISHLCAEGKSRDAVLGSAVLSAAIAATLVALATGGIFYTDATSPGPLFAAALAVISSLFLPMEKVLQKRERRIFLCSMATQAVAYAIQHFNQIDQDGDGLIVDKDLCIAMKNTALPEYELRLLDHIRQEQAEFGHVIDSKSEECTTFVPLGETIYPMADTITTYTYGINMDDLTSYTLRLLQRYRNW